LDKEEKILKAALPLFAKRGYYGTPVSLIAEKAGVGSGTIYRYFKDKEALVNALYCHWKKELFKQMKEGLSPDQPLRTQFHETWDRMTRFAIDQQDAFIFLESHHHVPYLDENSQMISDEISAYFIEILQSGQENEIIKSAPPEILLAVIFGSAFELLKAHWSDKVQLTPELMEQAEEMCWQAVRR